MLVSSHKGEWVHLSEHKWVTSDERYRHLRPFRKDEPQLADSANHFPDRRPATSLTHTHLLLRAEGWGNFSARPVSFRLPYAHKHRSGVVVQIPVVLLLTTVKIHQFIQ